MLKELVQTIFVQQKIQLGDGGKIVDKDDNTLVDVNGVTVADVITSPITGFVSGAGTVAATDTLLEAVEKLDGNIVALDTEVGADVTPVVRTNNPTIGANTVNANIAALDAAIGTDAQLTPAARTTGPVADANSVNTNIDALDEAIGFEGQMSGTPHVVTFPTTIFQALDKLDTYKSVQTFKKTIGGIGVASCDFNFVTAEDQAEQVIDLGEVIPALSRIVDVVTITNNAFTGAVSLGIEVGTTSGGNEILATSDVIAANALKQIAVGGWPVIAISASAGHVYVSGTPGANWSLVTAGKLTIYITFIKMTNI